MSHLVKTISIVLFLFCLAALSGCVSPVYTDYDRGAVHKFNDYKCFEVVSGEEQSDNKDTVLSPIVTRRIEHELNTVLKAHGFTDQCPSPDFRVRFHTVQKTVNQLNDFGFDPFYYGTFYGCRYGYSYIGSYPRLHLDQYEEGTFLVDIIDVQSNETVWRGAYVKRLGVQAPTDMEIRAILTEILEQFPPELE